MWTFQMSYSQDGDYGVVHEIPYRWLLVLMLGDRIIGFRPWWIWYVLGERLLNAAYRRTKMLSEVQVTESQRTKIDPDGPFWREDE